MHARYVLPAVVATLVLGACGSREEQAATQAQPAPASEAPSTELPERITLQTPGIIPEGVEYDTRNGRFLVGSIAQGTVFVVGTDGTLTPFIQDPDLKSSIGIEVDEERNRLLVANSDGAVFQGKSAGQAKLGIYALDSGQRLAMIDLAQVGPKDAKTHFANDVTVGPDGAAYVTNSMARVIYRVDPEGKEATVFLPNSFGDAKQFVLNGIVAHPSGYLLVAESTAGELYKVPLADPQAFTEVTLPEPVTGADGLVLDADGRLYVVRNDASNSVIALTSADDWASATIVGRGTFDGQGTTAALVNGAVYVVHPFFGDPNAMAFIERVTIN